MTAVNMKAIDRQHATRIKMMSNVPLFSQLDKPRYPYRQLAMRHLKLSRPMR